METKPKRVLVSHGPTKWTYVYNVGCLLLGGIMLLLGRPPEFWLLWTGFWAGLLFHTVTFHRSTVRMADMWEESFHNIAAENTEHYAEFGKKVIKIQTTMNEVIVIFFGYFKSIIQKHPELETHPITLRFIEKLNNKGIYIVDPEGGKERERN